jgi:hypothetical protein
LVTVTGTVPEADTAEAGIVAVNFAELAQVVAMAVPLKLTTALLLKLEPSTSSENCELPAAVLGGTSCAIVGLVPGVGGMVGLDE